MRRVAAFSIVGFLIIAAAAFLAGVDRAPQKVFAQEPPWFNIEEKMQGYVHQNTPEFFPVLSSEIQKLIDDRNLEVSAAGLALKNALADAANARDADEDLDTIHATRKEADDVIRGLQRKYTRASAESIREGVRTLFEDNLVLLPIEVVE